MKNSTILNGLICLCLLSLAACEEDISLEKDFESYDSFSPGLTTGETGANAEKYAEIVENPFIKTVAEPTSTFSIDADGASYANMRRMLHEGRFPYKDAIRTEEFVNYFHYDYPDSAIDPISLNGEIVECPWSEGHKLIRIGIKGKSIAPTDIPSSNFVLLIDVSGSMSSENKLALLKRAFSNYVMTMRAQDRIAIVTYAGEAGVVLGSTPGYNKTSILNAIEQLGAGGSTAGANGILTAYKIAEENYVPDGNNRIILGTDGDFNVGPSSTDELVKIIEKEREKGIYLTVLGVGTGNLNDHMLELISNHGNGTYEYLDTDKEAERVFTHEAGKFFTVAKDVKVQVTFNPQLVEQYRLIGYENRVLQNQDFEDDKKDAGEIGGGQTITALYEIIPASGARNVPAFHIEFRYKQPGESQSKTKTLVIENNQIAFAEASENTRFAAAVASYGLLIRNSEYKGATSYDQIIIWAENSMTFDPHGYRTEFISLVKEAKTLAD
jgi:Ca-activated chloride channel family protein